MIIRESITVSADQPGFIRLHHEQLLRSGIEMGGALWFTRENLPWVIQALSDCLQTYGFPLIEAQRGSDFFRVYESASEQELHVLLHNRRAEDSPHAGAYALLMSRSAAQSLVEQLSAL